MSPAGKRAPLGGEAHHIFATSGYDRGVPPRYPCWEARYCIQYISLGEWVYFVLLSGEAVLRGYDLGVLFRCIMFVTLWSYGGEWWQESVASL